MLGSGLEHPPEGEGEGEGLAVKKGDLVLLKLVVANELFCVPAEI